MYVRVPVALAASLLCIERSVADPSDADDTTGIFCPMRPFIISSWYSTRTLADILSGMARAVRIVGATLGSGT